jgi:hypothetical protein
VTNGNGKLKKVTSSVSTTEYTGFDILGRVTAHKQTTDGTDYTTGYTYKLDGSLDEETYPSGRVVKNVLDSDGDLSVVESKKNSTAGYWHLRRQFYLQSCRCCHLNAARKRMLGEHSVQLTPSADADSSWRNSV